MVYICPICLQNWKHGQKSIQCSSCLCWIHHNNRGNCSGLTNSEFLLHCNDNDKIWECDKCIANSFFYLPFTHLDNSDSDWSGLSDTNSILKNL